MKTAFSEIDHLCINTLRTLSIDMVQKANSGHPGLPLGASPMIYVLWSRHLKLNAKDPGWFDRDRFVLSAGHGSALLYSILHVAGFDLSLDDLKSFRQFGSRTPGHPESFMTPGVEATTGPLGQGAANAVGMAIAEQILAGHFNKPGHEIVDHYTYSLVSDGDLMEGISAEASSLAGQLELGKLIFLYDANDVSLDGPTSLSFSREDVALRYKAYGWQVLKVENGNEDPESIHKAIKRAKSESTRPSLIIIKTTIGYGSPNKSGKSAAHGSPLGDDEVALTKKSLGWDPEKFFYVPDEVYRQFRSVLKRNLRHYKNWQKRFEEYRKEFPSMADEWSKLMAGELPEGWDTGLPSWKPGESQATRQASGAFINSISGKLQFLVGGSADLSSSCLTHMKDEYTLTDQTYWGRNIYFGVREHAMGGISNGMAYHGGIRPFVSTFLVFSDYMRPAIRLASLNKLPVIYVWTHDSIAVGEDGPTHEPIEQVMSLRLVPGLNIFRPADAIETIEAWRWIIENPGNPSALILTRQKVPVLDRAGHAQASELRHGAYVLSEAPGGKVSAIIIATGSEVHIALKAQEMLLKDSIPVRVVSMPCWELFEKESVEYRNRILPPSITARVSVEAGVTSGWQKWIGSNGVAIGIDGYGISAPGDELLKHFGFTAENVAQRVRDVVA